MFRTVVSAPQAVNLGLAAVATNALWCGHLNTCVTQDLNRLDECFEKALPALSFLTSGRCMDGLMPDHYQRALNPEPKLATDANMKKARQNLSRAETWLAEYVKTTTPRTLGFDTSRAETVKEAKEAQFKSWTGMIEAKTPGFKTYLENRCVALGRKNACLALSLF